MEINFGGWHLSLSHEQQTAPEIGLPFGLSTRARRLREQEQDQIAMSQAARERVARELVVERDSLYLTADAVRTLF